MTTSGKLCFTLLLTAKGFIDGKGKQNIDLAPFISKPGQYEVAFTSSVVITGMRIETVALCFDNDQLTLQDFITRDGEKNNIFINRTAQAGEGSKTVLTVEMSSDNAVFQNKGEIKIRERSR